MSNENERRDTREEKIVNQGMVFKPIAGGAGRPLPRITEDEFVEALNSADVQQRLTEARRLRESDAFPPG